MAWTWIKKPLNKAILIGSCVLLVAAIALIAVGVTTHQEAGLLQVCWSHGIAVFQEDGDRQCENPEEVRWNPMRVPLAVSLATRDNQIVEESERRQTLRRAISDVNTQVGFTLFYLSNTETDVEVILDDSSGSAGTCEFYEDSGAVSYAIIRIGNTSEDVLTHRVLTHELGHAAGLAHDESRLSLMFPLTRRAGMTRFSDHDVRLLRELYNE